MKVIPVIVYNKNELLSEEVALKVQDKIKNFLLNKNHLQQFQVEKNAKRPCKFKLI
jgi:hypothetical protein